MYQLKVFTTAIFSKLMLGTKFTLQKWIALGLLFCGVCLIQLDTVQDSLNSKTHTNWMDLKVVTASMAVLLATLTSGFSGMRNYNLLRSHKIKLFLN
jgi:UDP-sugar transporter A1/2/3